MEFGTILRELRNKAGLGIKRLAPELGITYTYLSKLENNEVRPSEVTVDRIARYFDYDRNRLLLAAGKVPADILEILREHPNEAVDFLRKRFGRRREQRSAT
jgi:transcriptional regulator with XRE-family HTH domain